MPPAPKKARTDGDQKEEEQGEVEEKPEVEPEEQVPELEQDAPEVKGAKVKGPVTFLMQDTTLNCVQSAYGSILMPLTDCGLQYLLAGARSNAGLRSGRYLFEVKILELMNPSEEPVARQRLQVPRNQLRIGVSVAGSPLLMGDTEDGICFDMEGACLHNKNKEMCSEGFGQGDILGVVVNLDSASPNANTISLFKNGERASQPQALPSILQGKELFPAFTFKNVTFHCNFGPAPLASLPFTCHMVSNALAKDAVVAASPENKSEKAEVMFPACLPDEGTFDWLDLFLQQHKDYTELSDRAILAWAEKSGFSRYNKRKSSNDKPEMGFGISMMDDGSLRRLIQTLAPMQQRNYVVMEVKSNLLKDERSQLLARWPSSSFKRTAAVMMGEPPQEVRRLIQELALKAKQEASDAEFRAKKAEAKRKKQLERRQKQLERERKKAAKVAKKKQEALRRKLEAEKRKRERAARGEDPEEEIEQSKDEDPQEEENDSDEDLKDEMSDPDEQPPKVELTADERRQCFRKTAVPDMTSYALSTSFMKFSIPEKEEGFDEIRHDWNKAGQCDEYLKQWVRDRKLTVRIEDLQPSEWFISKWKDWQKTLQAWHAKYNQYKAGVAKKAADAAAKAAKKKAEAEKAAKAQEANAAMEEGQDEHKEDNVAEDAEKEETEGQIVDFDRLDVFGVEDVLNIGGGQPLFSAFLYEDWAVMSLRFEMYLLTHSFRRDVNDPDRVGILLEHLPFYYQKYFKKVLNTKLYGVDSAKELLDYVKDTIVVCGRNQVVQAMLPDDMESMGVFAMITEESRRDRVRRINLGEEGAALKMSQQPVPGVAPAGCRPNTSAGVRQRPAASGAAAAAARPAL